jgi:hypothetical protein
MDLIDQSLRKDKDILNALSQHDYWEIKIFLQN